jgi:hypothetical protein
VQKRALPLLLLLPVACAQPDPADPAAVLQEALSSHQASVAGLPGRPAGAIAEAPASRRAARTAPGTAEGPPTMAGQLVGHSPEVLTRLLGAPRLRREEGTAEVWHYSAPQCHLDLVLYRDEGPGAALRVAFASARAVGTARRGEAACLRDIARGATTRPGPGEPAGIGV